MASPLLGLCAVRLGSNADLVQQLRDGGQVQTERNGCRRRDDDGRTACEARSSSADRDRGSGDGRSLARLTDGDALVTTGVVTQGSSRRNQRQPQDDERSRRLIASAETATARSRRSWPTGRSTSSD